MDKTALISQCLRLHALRADPLRALTCTVIYITGLWMTCFGVVMILKSTLGVDAWNGVMAGMTVLTPLSLGVWSVIVQGTFWLTAALISHRPDFLCFIPILLKGIGFDLAVWVLDFVPVASAPVTMALYYATGYLTLALGTGFYITLNFSKMPIDGLMVAISERFGMRLSRARLCIEVSGFACLFACAGPFGIGTIIATFTFGNAVAASRTLAQRCLRPLLAGSREKTH